MSTVFDPDSFMNTSTEEQGSTTFTPVPERDDYVATIKTVKPRLAKDKPLLDVNWILDDPEATRVTGMKFPQVRQSIWLDMTEAGGLDMSEGKNITLNRLREAVNQNQKGVSWKPGDLVSQMAKISVKHRIDGENVYVDVKGVQKL